MFNKRKKGNKMECGGDGEGEKQWSPRNWEDDFLTTENKTNGRKKMQCWIFFFPNSGKREASHGFSATYSLRWPKRG